MKKSTILFAVLAVSLFSSNYALGMEATTVPTRKEVKESLKRHKEWNRSIGRDMQLYQIREYLDERKEELFEILRMAALDGDLATVQAFLDEWPETIDARDRYGLTPLEYAVSGGHKDVAAELIRRGANVNTKATLGQTPLLMAVRKGLKDMVVFLLENGADASTETLYNWTAHEWATKGGKDEIAKILAEKMWGRVKSAKKIPRAKSGKEEE